MNYIDICIGRTKLRLFFWIEIKKFLFSHSHTLSLSLSLSLSVSLYAYIVDEYLPGGCVGAGVAQSDHQTEHRTQPKHLNVTGGLSFNNHNHMVGGLYLAMPRQY